MQMYDPDAIISLAMDIQSQSEILRKQVDRLKDVIEDIDGVWRSPAQAQFSATFQEVSGPILTFCGQIDTFAVEAKTTAELVKNVEG